MDLLSLLQLRPGPPRLAVVGCAKNVGKTTALVALLRAFEEDLPDAPPPALLSIGVDGERRDAFSGASKPAVAVREGALCATASGALKDASARVVFLEDTGVRTPLGSVFIVQVEQAGDIRLAGIRHRADVLDVAARLHRLGAARVLIDGAYDRLVAADPRVSGGVLLATGAALGPTVDAVVAATRDVVRRLSLPPAPASLAPVLASPPASAPRAWIDGASVLVGGSSLLVADDALDGLAARMPSVLEIPGALSPRVADRILRAGLRDCTLLIADPTRALLPGGQLARLARRGLDVVVREPVRLLGVVANPLSPGGTALESGALCAALHEAMPSIPVVDVRAGIVHRPRP